MRTPIIAGNWKMYKTIAESIELVLKLKNSQLNSGREILVCPPFTALNEVGKVLNGSKIKLGGQNMHFKEEGALTGDISPLMLKDVGCEYVIIGHSERRHIFKEDDLLINLKVKSALKHGLKPILCVGETLEQRNEGDTNDVLKEQLLMGLEGVPDLNEVAIAYEPVWAIGTGETATPRQAEEAHAFIRSLFEGKSGKEVSDKLRILYGGSVKPSNAKEIMEEDDVDGVLVGGASLDAEQFLKIINFDN